MYEIYRQAAQELGFALSPATPALFTRCFDLTGRLDGYDVRIHRFVGRGGNVTFSAAFPVELGADLEVETAGLVGRLLRRLGSSSFRTGDAVFDRAFVAGTSDGAVAATILGAEVRAGLLSLPGDVRLDDAMVFTRLPHREESLALLLRVPTEIVRVAKLVVARGRTYR